MVGFPSAATFGGYPTRVDAEAMARAAWGDPIPMFMGPDHYNLRTLGESVRNYVRACIAAWDAEGWAGRRVVSLTHREIDALAYVTNSMRLNRPERECPRDMEMTIYGVAIEMEHVERCWCHGNPTCPDCGGRSARG